MRGAMDRTRSESEKKADAQHPLSLYLLKYSLYSEAS